MSDEDDVDDRHSLSLLQPPRSARCRTLTATLGNRCRTARRTRTNSGCTHGTELSAATADPNCLGTAFAWVWMCCELVRRSELCRLLRGVKPPRETSPPCTPPFAPGSAAARRANGCIKRASTADAYAPATALARETPPWWLRSPAEGRFDEVDFSALNHSRLQSVHH